MTQDEIIEMAVQAGFSSWDEGELQSPYVEGVDLSDLLESFAKLVAAKEREACAKVTEDAWMAFSHASISHDALNSFPELKFAATAIRARGEA